MRIALFIFLFVGFLATILVGAGEDRPVNKQTVRGAIVVPEQPDPEEAAEAAMREWEKAVVADKLLPYYPRPEDRISNPWYGVAYLSWREGYTEQLGPNSPPEDQILQRWKDLDGVYPAGVHMYPESWRAEGIRCARQDL